MGRAVITKGTFNLLNNIHVLAGLACIYTKQPRNRKVHELQRRMGSVTTRNGRLVVISGIPVGREETLPSRWHYAPAYPRRVQSPARQFNHFSTCRGNAGTYVKKIRWQFLVSAERWQLHVAKRQSRGYPGQRPCLSRLTWEAEERCSSWEAAEWRLSPTPYGDRELRAGSDGQCVKTNNSETLAEKKGKIVLTKKHKPILGI